MGAVVQPDVPSRSSVSSANRAAVWANVEASQRWRNVVFDIIDDDEWFELSLALNDTIAKLPPGSVLIESLEIPAFRPAIKASGVDLPAVETITYRRGQKSAKDAIRKAMDLAAAHGAPTLPGGLTITVTQTDDGATIAVVVAGLPGERCSFSSFDLRPGSHSIDIGFDTLQTLNGWAFRSDRHGTASTNADAA